MARNLGFQRRNEHLTDVRLICHSETEGKVRTVMAHRTILMLASRKTGVLAELFKVAKTEQVLLFTLIHEYAN